MMPVWWSVGGARLQIVKLCSAAAAQRFSTHAENNQDLLSMMLMLKPHWSPHAVAPRVDSTDEVQLGHDGAWTTHTRAVLDFFHGTTCAHAHLFCLTVMLGMIYPAIISPSVLCSPVFLNTLQSCRFARVIEKASAENTHTQTWCHGNRKNLLFNP